MFTLMNRWSRDTQWTEIRWSDSHQPRDS